MSEIAALLAGNQLVTLLGPGGIGKTRLAVESARAFEPTLSGGAVFVDLAPVSVEDVPLAIAEAVGAHAEGTASIPSIVSGRVVQPTLMLLDNFEHVLAAGPTIADLMDRVSPLKMLATSRSPLHIRGERIYRLAPLDAGTASNGDMAPAVRLFYERAASHGAEISRSAEDLLAVEAICRRLDGLPLAIELAAARTRLFSVAELAERLSGSLDALGAGAADLPERQRTIRATIDWSLDALTGSQKALFEALSVFPAGATLAAIEGAASVSGDALTDLAALVDASLVNVVKGLAGGTRYRQLVPLREYSAERLATSGQTDAAMGRMVDHLVETAPELGRRLMKEPSANEELSVDHANLMAAMRWSLDNDRTHDMVTVTSDVWVYFFNGDKAGSALQWAELADLLIDSPRLDWLLGFLAFQTGDYETAGSRLGHAAERFAAAGDEEWLARVRTFVGVMDPDLESGRRTLQAALDHFGAELSINSYLPIMFLSANAIQRESIDEAMKLRLKLVSAAENAEYSVLVAWARWNLALALYAMGDIEGTARNNDLVLRQMVADRYQEGIASAAGISALVAFSAGRTDAALRLIGGMQGIFSALGIVPWPELVVYLDAALEAARGRPGDELAEGLINEGSLLGLDELIDLAMESREPRSPVEASGASD